MPYTVWGAFDAFRTDHVDLTKAQTSSGRSSRDYLFDQLKALPAKYSWFPRLIGTYLSYGSFARSVKIRPLGDIDVLALVVGSGTQTAMAPNDAYTVWLRILDNQAPLAAYPDDYGFVSSTKVLNAFRSGLATVSAYSKAEIKRSGEAVTVSLASQPWVFDVVPAVPVNDGQGGFSHYLIPDGRGDWMATDPRRDAARVSAANKWHGSELLPVIRLLKYWNRRVHKPRLPSYYFETLVINTFQLTSPILTYASAIRRFFADGKTQLWLSCPDPKGLGPALDSEITGETKLKVSAAMDEATKFIGYADMYEADGKLDSALYWWGRIFGGDFPSYG